MLLKDKYCVNALEFRFLSESERKSCPGVLAAVTETTLLLDHKPDKKQIGDRYLLLGLSDWIPAETSVFSLLPDPDERCDS